MSEAVWLGVSIDRAARAPLQVQLYEEMKGRIASGRAIAGVSLPSTRGLAAELGVARSTVITVYEQLTAEGYIEVRPGARHRVCHVPGELVASVAKRRATRAASNPSSMPLLLAPGIPDLRLFPENIWARAISRSWRSRPSKIFADQDPAGSIRLREAIAGHLREWRGIDADPECILITSGSSGGLQLVLDALTEPGDSVGVEEPGYPALHRFISRRALNLALMPVDAQGASFDALPNAGKRLRLVFVTPSHQFPLGGAMSIARRHEMLVWAATNGVVVVEDDYDSEFRYSGRPLPALASLSSSASVIYLGTTSKVFSPTLRLGYLLAPRELTQQLREDILRYEQRASIVPQQPLASFIESGEFARHLRRMRRIYATRRRHLVEELNLKASSLRLKVDDVAAGLQVPTFFQSAHIDDCKIEKLCAHNAIGVRALSTYYRGAGRRAGLLIGFAGFDRTELSRGVEILSEIVEAGARDHSGTS